MEFRTTTLFIICLCGIVTVRSSQRNWGYKENDGPLTWGDSHELCNGAAQSPIAIDSNAATLNKDLGAFSRSLFDQLPGKMTIRNTGFSIQVDVENGYIIDSKDLLPASYKAVQFHIHWSNVNSRGSEHTLNGKQYFGEMHVVHYNMKYDSAGEAFPQSDGLAVLGFFIDDNYQQDNLAFNRLLDLVGKVNTSGANMSYESSFTPESLLPADIDGYFRYKGSLTTPPCFESVIWTVFDSPIRISRAQAQVLESQVFMEEGTPLHGNFRPLQPLNSRGVEKSSQCVRGVASFVNVSFSVLVAAVFVSLLHAY